MGPSVQIWEPQPRQAEALSCPAFELFFGGAKGGGKSDFLLGDYLAHYEEWGEAWKGILFRRSYKELDEIIGRSKQVIGKIPGATYVGGDQMMWRIPAPKAKHPGVATLRFRSLDSDLDIGKYNGHQYPWIAFDELTEFPSPGPYMFLMSGCCRSAAGAPCYVRATGNPGRPGHVWVKARFIDVARPFDIHRDPETGLTRCFVPSKLEDNQILMQNDPDYEKRLMMNQPHLVKALRYGDWEVVIGQVFSEYRRETHVIRPQVLGENWYRFASMDWGFSKPFSISWWAVSEEGRLILYKEWYGCETNQPNTGIRMGAKAVAEKAWAMSVHENVTTMVADPACWSKDDDLPSVAESFEAAGFKMVKAVNDRINGLMKMHEMMQTTGHDGRPMFLIFDTCHHWLRTVPFLTADPRNPEDINTELEDHCFPDGTMVATDAGLKAIETLKQGDRVITRDGPKPILDVWHEGQHETVIAHFDNGARLEATPAHKVWVEGRGFVRIDTMRYGDIVVFREDLCPQNESSTTGSCSGDTRNPSAKRIDDTSNRPHAIANEELNPSTEKSGSANEDQSPKDGRSTTRMATLATTASTTSNACLQSNTSEGTMLGRCIIELAEDRTPQPGTAAKPAESGMHRTAETHGSAKSQPSEPARNAAECTRVEHTENPASVQAPAKPVRFVGTTQGTTRTVHDLSVEGTHEYFADGVLVSNCYDSARYGCMSEFVLNPKALRVRSKVRPAVERKTYDDLRIGL